MALSGVYGYSRSLSSYTADRSAFEERSMQPETDSIQQETAVNEKQDNPAKAPKASNPKDFSFDFKKNNSYNLVGATSPVDDMDVEKAVSEMKKDVVLNQYKFFVGHVNLGTDADGTVRLKNIDRL